MSFKEWNFENELNPNQAVTYNDAYSQNQAETENAIQKNEK